MVYSSSCIYHLSITLFWGASITCLTHHLAFAFILSFILGAGHLPSSLPLPLLYSALLTYSLYSTCLYIFHVTYLLTLLNFHLYISLTCLTHLSFILFCITSPYSSSLYPQLYIFIFTLQHQPFLLLFILPLSPFHFPFIPYSLFSNYNIILYPFLYSLFYITLLIFITLLYPLFTIYYSSLLYSALLSLNILLPFPLPYSLFHILIYQSHY